MIQPLRLANLKGLARETFHLGADVDSRERCFEPLGVQRGVAAAPPVRKALAGQAGQGPSIIRQTCLEDSDVYSRRLANVS